MRDIAGYEGLYAIAPCGKVWSYRSKRFLKGSYDKDKYLIITLNKNGSHKTKGIHRLVAETYIPNPDNLPQVNHLDENREHNWVANLEWCTAKQNSNYGTRNAKLSKSVMCIELNKTFPSCRAAERETGISHGSISFAARGIRKNAGGYHWQYID